MSVNSTPHASVHDTANQAGSFSFSQVKPALSFEQQVELKRIYERVWPEKWPQMTATLDTLIRKYPGVDLVPLGFPEDWRQIIMEQT